MAYLRIRVSGRSNSCKQRLGSTLSGEVKIKGVMLGHKNASGGGRTQTSETWFLPRFLMTRRKIRRNRVSSPPMGNETARSIDQ